MQELRLVGVHQDGRHILLAAPDGTRYRVAINDELRVAARHRAATAGPAVAAIEPMSARDIQALIRSGVSAVEAADRSGWALSKVEVFAAPVLAERAHIAGMAARTRLRSADGGESERLEARVDRRLAVRGVEPGSAIWDAGRGASGAWQVFCDFVAGGRQRRAAWSFDAATGAVHPVDDEARWLAGDDDPTAKPQPHRLTGERVFDVEVDGGLTEPGEIAEPLVSTVEAAQLDRTDALMTAIRAHSHAGERRGRRRRPSPGPALDAEVLGAEVVGAGQEGPDGSPAGPLTGADELTFAELEVDPGPVPEPKPARDVEGADLADAAGKVAAAGEVAADGAVTAKSGSAGTDTAGPPAEEGAAGSAEAHAPVPGAGEVAAGSAGTDSAGPAAGEGAAGSAQADAPVPGAGEVAAGSAEADTPARAAEEVGAGWAGPEPVAAAGDRGADPAAPVAATAATETSDATEVVDFPDSDEIPPPARGTHPLDLAREAKEVPAPEPAAAATSPAEAASPPADAASPRAEAASPPAQAPDANSASSQPEAPPPPQAPKPGPPKPAPPASSGRRKGRVGVPNWNDVMFGPAKDAQD
ncbi:MAG: septation protein SepH [Dermatophilaceae bacterium]